MPARRKLWSLAQSQIWTLDSIEPLGLIVAGVDEEQRNVDKKIIKCRNSLFALLGPAFSYKCLMSPLLQTHLWRTCCYPTLVSGLAALPIRPTNLKSLEIFHRKILRGILKLSKSSPISAIHFLLGKFLLKGYCISAPSAYSITYGPTQAVLYTPCSYTYSRCATATQPPGQTMFN